MKFINLKIVCGIACITGAFYSQIFAPEHSIHYNPLFYSCANPQDYNPLPGSGPFGYLKPAFTDIDPAHPEAYFRVMIIFVQFANETGAEISWWPPGYPPVYMNEMIAVSRRDPIGGNWWDNYSGINETLSDYWFEQSRGRFHVIGVAYSVVLDHDKSYYESNGKFSRVNEDVYEKLKRTYSIDWREFDKWKIDAPNSQSAIFKFEPDGYVDMIYKIHRSHAPRVNMPAGGVAALGGTESQGIDYLVDTANNIFINGAFFDHGSGITMSPGFGGSEFDSTYLPYAPLTKEGVLSFSGHEHGHYLFGWNHTAYGKMSGAGAPYGVDECLSPWESVYLGYMLPRKVDYSVTNYSIGDFSSRHSNDTGEVLEVPVSLTDPEEVFLIASRRKVSSYDRIMWGDTAHGYPYRVINPEYGKGVYIYHAPYGHSVYPRNLDQECADGVYSWSFQGYVHPDWSNEQNVEYYKRISVSYDNDQSAGSLTCADGKSVFTWFGIGKLHDCIGCDGTDRIFTNKIDIWTSREFQGDRWDAWNVGYNEMFSPYSSPSTKMWANEYSGIFIWYHNFDSVLNKAEFKIFRAGYGGMSEDSILANTPPSKPMGITAGFTECVDGYKYPKIYWLHNMEPDMTNSSISNTDKKSYYIYMAVSDNHNEPPVQYSLVDSVKIHSDSTPYFIDYSNPVWCTGYDSSYVVLRYEITAIDAGGWHSVKSDFASVICSTGLVVNIGGKNTKALRFELMQNFPNPFNPTTRINYTISVEGKVSLVVYDLLGREVKVLLDEVKKAGRYFAEFNGVNLPSGVYFYVLKGPSYTKAKKMVLLK